MELQSPPGWNCTLEDFSPKPRRGGVALGRFFALGQESKAPPRWNCTWKIFRPCARTKYPAGVELHLEDFSPLGKNYKPHPDGIALWRNFRPNPAGVELHLEVFLPLGEDYKPHPGGIGLGRFSAPGQELQTPPGWNCSFEDFSPKPHRGGIALGRCFALGRESQTPPGWNCTWKIFCPWARITNPTPDGIALWKIFRSQTPPGWNCTLEDLSPLGENDRARQGRIALWKIFRPCENYKPRPGGIGFGRIFALARESQTPSGWNCTWKIFRPCPRIANPAGVELHLEDLSLTNPAGMELHFGRSFALGRE
jgi:hypothetical protein